MWSTRVGKGLSLSLIFALWLAPTTARAGVSFGQLDDFQSDTAGWQQGHTAPFNPNPPTVIATGGPSGTGDPYLQSVSSGTFGAGGKQVMFNRLQWTGNYVSAGVTRITAEMENLGTAPLAMRVWVTGGTLGGQYGSTNAVALPADGHWHAVTFDLSSAGMTAVSPTDTLANVMGSVSEFRFLSAAGGPSQHGDVIASTLGVDQIRGTTIPGDANHDNVVNFNDLLTLAQHYGMSNAHWEDGDFNFDGMVNFNDLLSLAQNYGSSVSFSPPAAAVAAVPEPAMVLPLTVLTLLASARFTRRPSPSR